MCVILYTEINGKKILAKNRDGEHIPEVEIIHEIVNNIEVVYLKDNVTGWVEGMTENGSGIINTTFNENNGGKRILLGKKKMNFIHHLLCQPQNKTYIIDYINKHHQYLEGHTLFMIDYDLYHIENNIKGKNKKFILEKSKNPSVYTNHGIRVKPSGFTRCSAGLSSFLRRKTMQTELILKNNVKSVEDLLDVMNVNYTNVDPRFHTYRDKRLTKKNTSTSGQLIMNITDKEFIYYTDIHNSGKVTYINNLPTTYKPKIRVTIKETEKKLQNKKKLFTNKYIQNLYRNFPCSSKTRKKRE